MFTISEFDAVCLCGDESSTALNTGTLIDVCVVFRMARRKRRAARRGGGQVSRARGLIDQRRHAHQLACRAASRVCQKRNVLCAVGCESARKARLAASRSSFETE